jgi:hypothetical protein
VCKISQNQGAKMLMPTWRLSLLTVEELWTVSAQTAGASGFAHVRAKEKPRKPLISLDLGGYVW